ncbi:MAG: GIY-YIG nuclease family protein [archaeon]
MRHGFIYLIENKKNGKKYIGQTKDFARRWIEHCTQEQLKIDEVIQKYGWDNFETEVLETPPLDKLNEREQYWIEKYGTYQGEGYNFTPGGNTFPDN